MHTYYTVYCTENLINGKCYVGAHVTSNVNDDYLGSGLLINRAIEKYGRENFRKTWVGFGIDEADMYRLEAEFVNKKIVEDDRFYNLNVGGFRGPAATRESSLKGAETRRKKGTAVKPPKTTSESARKGMQTKLATGVGNPMSSAEARTKLSEFNKTAPKLTCPHCEKSGHYANMHRWHFDNCKHKEENKHAAA